MHEMALTLGVIDLIADAARRESFSRARVVVLELGDLGHVEPEAMLFCFDAASRGTVAEGARLEIVRVPGQGWCLDCAKTVALAERFGACPECGRHHVQMTAGDELRVKELEVE
ncbi:hydrogenase maturation nickel metallochaperone HypA [Rhodoplanes elegans]|uniref:Hydrogenase maturation factor HypA n=1 Tax=Rhodoplanes elegans TaxID=29408 RepID=A0A327KJB8_9BRAD|nr:hydrogenase maturation nickel metallochaperone HypA [Rhodoplanes elegans]MBK5961217.1 hydrogenase maturation nickel metallochaperone HypA [Rhodoplanes elegans]RAI37585.1 hydrogenase maturation nickel metallochaperone HypA [Rhodoplanes elegans]